MVSRNSAIKFITVLLATVCIVLAGCFSSPETEKESLKITPAQLTLREGETRTLTVNISSGAEWLSENENIVTVDDGGTVTAVAVGETKVLALKGSLSAECSVTVIKDDSPVNGYALFWSDEFDGESLDSEKWGYQLGTRDDYGNSQGPANWGNDEMQFYREENVKVKDGNLIITAQKEDEKIGGKSYTSGRITTRGKFSFTYGYVEARIKSPKGDGMWPAFWMLPQPPTTQNSHNEYGGWARNGELDIMEAKGRLNNVVDTTLHFGDNWPKAQRKGKSTTLASDIDKWHTYAVDWRKESIAWIVDGSEVLRLKYTDWWTAAVSSDINPYAPFDKPFFILLNLAVGGTYDPTGTANFKEKDDFVSASMFVDYVRVYAPKNQ